MYNNIIFITIYVTVLIDQAFGRTPLTSISPKKTWEGALVGLTGCIATCVLLSKILSWPTSTLGAIGFGFLNFFGSLYGDLLESMIKRDVGVKDSGSLIPSHGNFSFSFTGVKMSFYLF
ncbi:hypothetical protein Lser_V15G40936 [Lactuca serriola]